MTAAEEERLLCAGQTHKSLSSRSDRHDYLPAPLSEIAMLGVGAKADVIRESAANVKEAIDRDGILRMNFDKPHNRRYSPRYIEYPSPYGDVRLEADYKRENALLCDLTFWALEFLWLAKERGLEV